MGYLCFDKINVKREYVRPVAGRPLTLLVHTTSNFDLYKVAEVGVAKTLNVMQDRSNVLEIVDIGDREQRSYSRLDSRNSLTIGTYGFLFDNAMIPRFKPYLDGVQDIIFTGGASIKCLNWSLLSVLAMKTFGASPDIAKLFIRHLQFFIWASDMIESGECDINNGRKLRLHLNNEAIFSRAVDLVVTENDDLAYAEDKFNFGNADKTFKWYEDNLRYPEKKRKIFDANMKYLPKFYRGSLQTSGLNIAEYMDGIRSPRMISKGRSGSVEVELYHWSDTEKMDKFFLKNI